MRQINFANGNPMMAWARSGIGEGKNPHEIMPVNTQQVYHPRSRIALGRGIYEGWPGGGLIEPCRKRERERESDRAGPPRYLRTHLHYCWARARAAIFFEDTSSHFSGPRPLQIYTFHASIDDGSLSFSLGPDRYRYI